MTARESIMTTEILQGILTAMEDVELCRDPQQPRITAEHLCHAPQGNPMKLRWSAYVATVAALCPYPAVSLQSWITDVPEDEILATRKDNHLHTCTGFNLASQTKIPDF